MTSIKDTYFNNPTQVGKVTSEKVGFFIMPNQTVLKKTRSTQGLKFAQVPISIIESKYLSLQSKGLYGYLESRPNNWIFYMRALPEFLPESYYQISKAWKELRAAGYIVSVQIRVEGRYVGWKHWIHPSPTTYDDLVANNEIDEIDNDPFFKI